MIGSLGVGEKCERGQFSCSSIATASSRNGTARRGWRLGGKRPQS